MSIERNFEPAFVGRLAAAEKQMQQSYRPIIGVHKWFARRPGSLFRALLLAEFCDGPVSRSYLSPQDLSGRVILDPFMGGGTTMFEANRVGSSVLGFDTNPLSRWIVERELEPLDVDAFRHAGEAVCEAVEAQIGHLYRTACNECGEEVPVKSFLWVKVHRCSKGHETLLLPGPLLAGRKMDRHTHNVLVCGQCRHLNHSVARTLPKRCPQCGVTYAKSSFKATGQCHVCDEDFVVPMSQMSRPYDHALIGIEYHCQECRRRPGRRGRFFKAPDKNDFVHYQRATELCAETTSPFWPKDPVPAGDETKRLHRWGYHQFSDMHNPRQLYGLHVLAEEISRQPKELRPALATVYSDFVRYQNMLCRYDTAALKILDVFSIHGFPVSRIQCEAALVGVPTVGSGGYRHFLRKFATAKAYCREPFETVTKRGRREKVKLEGELIEATFVETDAHLGEPRAALLKATSAATFPPEEESVDLVLTDPPFFANVQYSELMDFCYAWLRRLVKSPTLKAPTSRSDDEITGNEHAGRDLECFTVGLSRVYSSTALALKRGAAFVFTYHHSDPLSYAALVVACLDAGLVPQAAFVSPSEMRGSVHISRSRASRIDTVFVLRKPPAVAESLVESEDDRVKRACNALRRAGIAVNDGDRKCMRFGFAADGAMRGLMAEWDGDAPIAERLQRATVAIGQRLGTEAASLPVSLPRRSEGVNRRQTSVAG